MPKQSKMIVACMVFHNFIRESSLTDSDFDMCDRDDDYVPLAEASSSQGNGTNPHHGDEDRTIHQFRDWIADGLFELKFMVYLNLWTMQFVIFSSTFRMYGHIL
jgi:hypothetical protein